MKFYQFLCQFVKISPFFPESLEKSLDKVVSMGEKNFSVHKKYMNFFQYRKTALDEHLYKLSAGRSMVEMLGVLAIIGILSVGAISGYSKAMTKYKLNKQTEQINSLINNSYQLWNSDKSINMSTNLTPILIKLNIVPSEMIKEGKTNVIIDALKNDLYIAWEATSSPSPYNGFFQLTILGRGENYKIDDETCLNILNLSKEISPILWQTHFVYSAEDEDSTNYGVRTFGDSYCTKSTSCLKDLTISKIRELCNTCYEQKKCYMRILWL